MRALCFFTVVAGVLVGLPACNTPDAYSRGAKTVDSLSGAISGLMTEMEKADTNLLQRSVTRFSDYQQFIQQHITDTIEKAEADNLQHFYIGGDKLTRFYQSRPAVRARARLIGSQLSRLSEDLKNRSGESAELPDFIRHEKTEVNKLLEGGYLLQKNLHTGTEEFINSLPGVERLIKSRNRGELPTFIQDTIHL